MPDGADRVVDRGPGIPAEDARRSSSPSNGWSTTGRRRRPGARDRPRFHRGHGRRDHIEDTPGGGTTMVVALARAAEVDDDVGPRRRRRSAHPAGADAPTSAPATTRSSRRHGRGSAPAGRPPPSRRRDPRPRPPRHGRHRGRPRPAGLDQRPDPDPVGPRSRGRQGRRPRRRCRRLRRQALRHGRAAGPPTGRAAPRPPRREAPGRSTPSTSSIDLVDKRVTDVPRATLFSSHRPSGTCWRCSPATRAAWSRHGSSCRRCGDPITARRATTCASTWPTCAGSSNPSPRDPAISSPSPEWGTASCPPVRRGVADGGAHLVGQCHGDHRCSRDAPTPGVVRGEAPHLWPRGSTGSSTPSAGSSNPWRPNFMWVISCWGRLTTPERSRRWSALSKGGASNRHRLSVSRSVSSSCAAEITSAVSRASGMPSSATRWMRSISERPALAASRLVRSRVPRCPTTRPPSSRNRAVSTSSPLVIAREL